MQQAKLFLRYADDIVRTVKADPEKMLRAAKLLHPNSQFTIETPNTNGNLAFLDLKISIDKSRKINCGWYQKSTGTILNLPPSVKEKCDKQLRSSTSTWQENDKAMKINREQWLDNQYPEIWSSRVASHALEKIIREGKNKKKHG